MEITRLPVTPFGRPSPASVRSSEQTTSVGAAERVEASNPRPRTRGPVERVVQGELLHRERSLYQSTRAFLTERSLDQAQPAERQAQSPEQSRPAISRYLNNTRPESVAEMTQGRSLNLFV